MDLFKQFFLDRQDIFIFLAVFLIFVYIMKLILGLVWALFKQYRYFKI